MKRKFVIDTDTTDDFLDYPRLVYAQPNGTISPLFTDEELERIGRVTGTRLEVPESPHLGDEVE